MNVLDVCAEVTLLRSFVRTIGTGEGLLASMSADVHGELRLTNGLVTAHLAPKFPSGRWIPGAGRRWEPPNTSGPVSGGG